MRQYSSMPPLYIRLANSRASLESPGWRTGPQARVYTAPLKKTKTCRYNRPCKRSRARPDRLEGGPGRTAAQRSFAAPQNRGGRQRDVWVRSPHFSRSHSQQDWVRSPGLRMLDRAAIGFVSQKLSVVGYCLQPASSDERFAATASFRRLPPGEQRLRKLGLFGAFSTL